MEPLLVTPAGRPLTANGGRAILRFVGAACTASVRTHPPAGTRVRSPHTQAAIARS